MASWSNTGTSDRPSLRVPPTITRCSRRNDTTRPVVRAGSDTDHITATVIVRFIHPLDDPPKYPGDIFVHCRRNPSLCGGHDICNMGGGLEIIGLFCCGIAGG